MPVCILWFIGGIVASLVGNSLRINKTSAAFGYAIMVVALVFFVVALINADDIEDRIARTLFCMGTIILMAIIAVVIVT